MTNKEFKKALIDNGCIEGDGVITDTVNIVTKKGSYRCIDLYMIKKEEVVGKVTLTDFMANELANKLDEYLSRGRRYPRYTNYYNNCEEGDES